MNKPICLSKQQIRALSLITQGYDNEEIAAILKVRRSTLDNHIKAIKRKTGIRSRVLLAFYALGKGMVTQDEIRTAIRRDRKEQQA